MPKNHSLPTNPKSSRGSELKPVFDAYLQFNWDQFEYIVFNHILTTKIPGGELDHFYQAVKLIPTSIAADVTAGAAVLCGIILPSRQKPTLNPTNR